MIDQGTLFTDAFAEPVIDGETEPMAEGTNTTVPHADAKFVPPSPEQWARLYALASRVRELAPWRWMHETDIFAVEDPTSKQLGFVSTMGQLGQHLSIAVYLGPKALYDFWGMQESGEDPMAIFDVPQLQVSFEDRDGLEKQDRQIIKDLGLKFRGRQQYPLFRSIRAGYVPWFIDAAEAEILTHALEQVFAVAPLAAEDPDLLSVGADFEAHPYLIRVSERHGQELQWRDEVRRVPPPAAEFPQSSPLDARAEEFKSCSRIADAIFEMDLFYVPAPTGGRGERPYFPKAVLIADAATGLILGTELFPPADSPEAKIFALADSIGKVFMKNRALPAEIRVGNPRLFWVLRRWTQSLNIVLRQTNDLPAIAEAKQSMFGFFTGQ
jgi:hypothetical protein